MAPGELAWHPVSDLEITLTPFAAGAARAMVAEAQAELARRYGGDGDETPMSDSEFDPPEGAFFIAYRDGLAAGCAGWRSHGEHGEVAELKRMYVGPFFRSSGVATALLRVVEDSARSAGRAQLILECGPKQPEAVALYEKHGYERIENFGYHRDKPGVLSYGRDL